MSYGGAELLLRIEDDLRNYNAWIVDMFVRALAPVAPTARVLDFGCGIGTLSALFAERTGVRPEGVEIDPAQRVRFAARGFVAHAALEDAPGPYDAVFTSNVLEHIEDDVAALRGLRERLAPGGALLVYVPAFEAIRTSMDDRVGHFRRYRRGDLARKVAQAGFSVRQARYCDSLGFGLALAFRLLGREGEPSSASLRLFDRVLLPCSKALDLACAPLFGKNVFLVADRGAP